MPASLPVPRSVASLDLFLLGVVELPAVIALQKLFLQEVQQSARHRAVLLMCEHPPTRTLGTNSAPQFTSAAEREAQPPGWQEITTDRAGNTWEHGPTQLGIYPIVSLAQTELSPLSFRHALETLLATACKQMHVPEVHSVSGLGVECRQGVLARTGLHVQQEITQFGAYLNVGQPYNLGAGVKSTSLQAATMRPASIAEVKTRLATLWEEWLGATSVTLSTRHPLLKRTSQPISPSSLCPEKRPL